MSEFGEGGRAMISEATSRYHAAMGELRDVPWRTGRSNPRNLYADIGGDWKGHPPIGAMDSPELAREAVEAHNAMLDLEWLTAACPEVTLGRRRPSPALREFWVNVLHRDGEVLAVFQGDTFGAPLAEARAWAEREGYAA